jgi:hypothetical protein
MRVGGAHSGKGEREQWRLYSDAKENWKEGWEIKGRKSESNEEWGSDNVRGIVKIRTIHFHHNVQALSLPLSVSMTPHFELLRQIESPRTLCPIKDSQFDLWIATSWSTMIARCDWGKRSGYMDEKGGEGIGGWRWAIGMRVAAMGWRRVR